MKQINVYFQAVTKVQMGHVLVEDGLSMEDTLKQWLTQGYARVHYMSNAISIYVPWTNIVYCQYKDIHHENK